MTGETRSILIIDDDADLCSLLEAKLKEEGYTVFTAHSVQDGAKLALEKHPDLILLDILLPDGSGHDVLEKIRADEWGKTALIILLTNVENSESATDAMLLGSNEYLIKSDLSLPDVVARIREKLSARMGA